MKLITEEWLSRAKDDLDVAKEILNLSLIKRLDEVYISARYPSDLGLLPSGKPSIQDAKELYEFANTP
jgi:HEPN domain-containing protein